MPIQIHWDDESHNLLRLTFEGTWTLEDVLIAGDTVFTHLNAAAHRIDIILDFSRPSARIPQNLPTLIPRMKGQVLPSRGIVLLIEAPPPIRNFVGMLQGTMPDAVTDLYFMDSLRDAYLLLEKPVPDTQSQLQVAG
jgi:hypothetical protein